MDTTLFYGPLDCNTHQYESSRRASYKRLKSHGRVFGLLGSYHTRIPTSMKEQRLLSAGSKEKDDAGLEKGESKNLRSFFYVLFVGRFQSLQFAINSYATFFPID